MSRQTVNGREQRKQKQGGQVRSLLTVENRVGKKKKEKELTQLILMESEKVKSGKRGCEYPGRK